MDEKIDYYESNFETPKENFESIEQKFSRLHFNIRTLRNKVKNLSKDLSLSLADVNDLQDEANDTSLNEESYQKYFKQYKKLEQEVNDLIGEFYE
jgi:Skp family chaperone for outer membrane proteins